jgi:hypothetical protein
VPPFNTEEVFREELLKAYEKDREKAAFEPEEWHLGGRGKENLDWWMEHGAAIAQNFIDWYEARDDVNVWIAPDGRPAIELDLLVNFGDIPVKMYVDLVLEIGRDNPALVVTDYKSGSTRPKNHRQLGIYATGIERTFGIRPRYGTYFMCRGGKNGDEFFLQPAELSAPQYSYEYLSGLFETAERGINACSYPSNPGDACRTCQVAYACTEVQGEKAHLLDPNYPR